jgi:hypothetical protein
MFKVYKWLMPPKKVLNMYRNHIGVKVDGSNSLPKQVYEAEAKTVFPIETDETKMMNELEESIGCDTTYIRHKIGAQNIWNIQIPPTTVAVHKGTPAELSKIINRNVRAVHVYTDNLEKHQFVFGIFENYCVVNTHVFASGKKILMRIFDTDRGDIATMRTHDTWIEPINRVDLGGDISVVRVNVSFTDIRVHLSVNDYNKVTYEGFINGEVVYPFMTMIPKMESPEGEVSLGDTWEYPISAHYVGMCGRPLTIQKNSGSSVVGIHCGAHAPSSVGFSAVLNKTTILKAIELLAKRSNASFIASENIVIPPVGLPIAQSMIFHENTSGVRYLGKWEGKVLVKGKSKLIPTLICKGVEALFRKHLNFSPNVEYAPPLMEPVRRDGEYIYPKNIAMRKICAQKGTVSPTLALRVSTILSVHIIKGLEKKGVTKCNPINADDAINGILNDDYISRINVSTAGGFGYPGKKEDYLPLDETEANRVKRLPRADLLRDVNLRLANYRRGLTMGVIYKTVLKDEARDKKKVKLGKTRVFYPTPVDVLIVSRMMLSNFYSWMVEHCEIFGSAIGINMHSDANGFYKSLREFSDLLMEGDYESYDQKMLLELQNIANAVIYNVCKWFGYNDEALMILRTLMADLAFPILDFDKDLFVAFGITASGQDGTAQRNSLLNLIMMLCCWYSTPEVEDKNFFDYVKPATFGDDSLAAVKPVVADYFNNIVFRDFCSDTLQIVYTPAEKDSGMQKFISYENCSFLKRKFIYREDLGRVVAPLDLNSIYKSMTWIIPSQSITRAEQMLSICVSALWEFSLHMEREKFDLLKRDLMEIYEFAYGHCDAMKVPTFDDIMSSVLGPEVVV